MEFNCVSQPTKTAAAADYLDSSISPLARYCLARGRCFLKTGIRYGEQNGMGWLERTKKRSGCSVSDRVTEPPALSHPLDCLESATK